MLSKIDIAVHTIGTIALAYLLVYIIQKEEYSELLLALLQSPENVKIGFYISLVLVAGEIIYYGIKTLLKKTPENKNADDA